MNNNTVYDSEVLVVKLTNEYYVCKNRNGATGYVENLTRLGTNYYGIITKEEYNKHFNKVIEERNFNIREV